MHAFILAGGFATRLWPLTEKRAKPLLPLAGKPILEHLLEKIPSEIPVTVSTNAAFREGFTAWLQTIQRPGVQLVVEDAADDAQKLGALGAIAQWLRTTGTADDVLLLTGDNYVGFRMEDFLGRYQQGTPLLATYDVGSPENARGFGTVILAEKSQRIAAFEEKPAAPKTSLVSTGCSVLPQEALPALIEFAKEHPDNVGGIFEELLRRGWAIDSFTFTEPWFDIGSFRSYLDATQKLVGERALLGEGATCDETECFGSVVIGARSSARKCALRNVVLFPDCTVEDCVLEDCVVDSHSTLRGTDLTGKMVREGTVLAASGK